MHSWINTKKQTEKDMNNLHLHDFRGVKHIPREMLIKAKMWNVMCEMSSADNSAIVQSTIVIP